MDTKVTRNVLLTDTRYGEMCYYHDDVFIGHSLEKYGEYSEGEPALWRRFLKPGDTAFDVGANIGTLTVAMADIVGADGKIYAFEAQPENFLLLESNVSNYGNIHVHNMALGNTNGILSVKRLDSLPHTNYGGFELDGRGEYSVPISTLDKWHMGQTLDFMKIDVEGMEAEVIQGATKTIAQHRPILYVENDRPEKADKLIKLIHSLGYKMYLHTPPLYSEFNFKYATVDEPNLISINMLCIPNECDYSDITDDMQPVYPSISMVNKVSGKDDWACVVRLGGIGDNLIAASVLRPLKKAGYMIEVITKKPQGAVFENNPFIDKLTFKTDKELPQNDQAAWQKYWWSRSCEFAKFINLSHSVEVLMARFPADTAFWWPQEFRRKHCGQSYLEAAHDVVGVPHEFGPLFFPTDDEKDDITSFKRRHKLDKKPLVSWVIRGTRIDKIYPYAGHAVARLLAEVDCNIIMLSAPSTILPDATYAEQIMNHVKMTNSSTDGLFEARHVEGAHNWPIRRMLTLAQHSDLVIGPDSGVAWAVAMESVPKIVLHSHASVQNIAAHWLNTISLHADPCKVKCSPCHLLHDSYDTCQEMQIRAGLEPSMADVGAACITSIPVQAVVDAAKAALSRRTEDLIELRDNHATNVTITRGGFKWK